MINPSAVETSDPSLGTCGDGIDQDCDGLFVACDEDGDGFPSDRDCNDQDPAINPDATEICQPEGAERIDENCNGRFDELAECERDDIDGDGAIDCLVSPVAGCDCNDCDAGIHPMAPEICANGVDEDCDGLDAACAPDDLDSDGWVGGRDCREMDPRFNQGAFDDCRTPDDESCGRAPCSASPDTDQDGYSEPAACEGMPEITPFRAEVCDSIDQDCDGTADEILGASVAYLNDALPPIPGGLRWMWPEPSRSAPGGLRSPAESAQSIFEATSPTAESCRGGDNPCNPVAGRDFADECVNGTCNCSFETVDPPLGGCDGRECCPPNPDVGPNSGGCKDLQTDFDYCGRCSTSCASTGGRADPSA